MKKRKREDRLSELPDSVIFHILSFVPMLDVVRTTILSKRWRNLWTTTPFLVFDYDDLRVSINCDLNDKDRRLEFRSSVNQFLFRWNGVRILEFRVVCCFDSSLSSEMELWVDFAIAKGVENLYLRDFGEEEECWVPQCLFSCSSLKLLSIISCNWSIDGIVQWNKLKELEITQGFEVTEHLISQILCGSPMLEVFKLSFLDQGQNLNIRSNILKELSIHKHLAHCDDLNSEYLSLVSVSELKIWTPNLETLLIKGLPFSKCGLIDVPASTHVTIEFSDFFFDDYDTAITDQDDVKDLLNETLVQILQAIQHVESVELICCYVEVLGGMEQEKRIYSKVKSLVFMNRYSCYDPFIGPLKLFSQLSRLVLGLNAFYTIWGSYSSFQAANLPKSFQLQLRTVDITWCEGDGIFPFVEFLLKYADKLEKMVFRVDETPRSSLSDSLLLALQELVRMPRSSPACKILTIPLITKCSSS